MRALCLTQDKEIINNVSISYFNKKDLGEKQNKTTKEQKQKMQQKLNDYQTEKKCKINIYQQFAVE